MNQEIECRSAAEAHAAIGAGDVPVLVGDFELTVSVSCKIVCKIGSPRVVAWGSSSPRVVARESSSPSVEAWGSSSPRVEAWGSSSPSVVAWGSSSPSVEASGYVHLRLRGKISAKATKFVTALLLGALSQIEGCGHVQRVDISTGRDWCDYYGIPVADDGTCVLFKAVDKNWGAPHNGFKYIPGTKPKAPDWDGGKAECGGGLHYSPSPGHARRFLQDPGHYVACLVRVDDLAVHWNDGTYPDKCKGPEVLECWECDEDGKRIEQPATESVS